MTVESENNNRAVVLSEEVDFMESLLGEELPPGAHTMVLDRRDELRAAMQTAEGGSPTDEADEGYPMPDGVEEGDSDEYEVDDAVQVAEAEEVDAREQARDG